MKFRRIGFKNSNSIILILMIWKMFRVKQKIIMKMEEERKKIQNENLLSIHNHFPLNILYYILLFYVYTNNFFLNSLFIIIHNHNIIFIDDDVLSIIIIPINVAVLYLCSYIYCKNGWIISNNMILRPLIILIMLIILLMIMLMIVATSVCHY